MIYKSISISFLIAVLTLAFSCSATRKLPEGKELYKKARVKIVKPNKKIDTKGLKVTYDAILKKPKPNKKFLGVRWQLRRYNLFYTKKEKGLLHWLQKKTGEPPVIYDEQITKQTERVLENKAINKGFFTVDVSSKVKRKRKGVKVTYIVRLGEPYRLGRISNTISDSLLRTKITAIQNNSLLKPGELYDLNKIKAERDRITSTLRQEGVYYFRSDLLKFRADTLQRKGQVNLDLVLKNDVNIAGLLPRTIHEILVFPGAQANKQKQIFQDTLDYEGLKIIYDKELIRASTLRDAIVLKKDKFYSQTAHQKTLERLSFLQNYQFTDIQFEPSNISDSLLNVKIHLTPRKRESIEGSLGLSLKSGVYIGPEVSLSYLNRNLFKGAERLRFTVFGNYNFPLFSDIISQQEQGASLEFSKPGLIVPLRNRDWSEKLIAKTSAKAEFELETVRIPLKGFDAFLDDSNFNVLLSKLESDSTYAPSFSLMNLDFSYSYFWRKRVDVRHEFEPLNVVLQAPQYEEKEMRDFILRIVALDAGNNSEDVILNFEKMLITKPGYTFLYDSRLKRIKRQNFFYRGKVAASGNRLLSNIDLLPESLKQSFFFQLENDFRYFWRPTERQTVGFRFAVNVSLPIGNEIVLPFFDLYSVGGPNSVRAFQPRQVGPGSVEPTEQTFFFTGNGDILLESTLEWRPKISRMVELGLFVDAGNVWLYKGGINDNDLARFDVNTFYKQLAVGTGFGFRFDFDILVLRTDLSFPVTKPWLPEGERLVLEQIDFGSSSWLNDNLTFFLAFGYSF